MGLGGVGCGRDCGTWGRMGDGLRDLVGWGEGLWDLVG